MKKERALPSESYPVHTGWMAGAYYEEKQPPYPARPSGAIPGGRHLMKLGLMTAALPMLNLDQLASWAAESGYQMLEIACWPPESGGRRYGGVSHIDVVSLDRPKAKEIRAMLDAHGLGISSLGYYPNPLDPDEEVSGPAIAHLKKVIDAAVLLDVEIVGTFVGADMRKSNEQN